jgi:dienelactone hydrolase
LTDPDISGPTTSKSAIILIHDIFGPVSQIIQGADRLAAATGHLILTPDFFHGKTIAVEDVFPMDSDEKTARVTKFVTEVVS